MHPSEIKIGQYELSVYDLYTMIKNQMIVIESDPSYWIIERKSKSIESILLGLTMTPIYVDASRPEEWIVLDGGKRLSAIYEFISGNFPLKGLEFLEDLEPKYFDSLPRPIQRKLQEAKLTIYSFNQGISPEVRLSLIKRIVPDIKKGLSPKMLQRLLSYEAQNFIDSLSSSYFENILKNLDRPRKDLDYFLDKLDFLSLYFVYTKDVYYYDFNPKVSTDAFVLYINERTSLIRNMGVKQIWEGGLKALNVITSNCEIPIDVNKFMSKNIGYFIISLGDNLTEDEVNKFHDIRQELVWDLAEFLNDEENINRFRKNSKLQRINQLNKVIINRTE